MKKSLIILALATLFAGACKKNSNTTSTPTTPSNSKLPNSVTINTGGKTFTESGEPYMSSMKNGTNTVQVITTKGDGKATIAITVSQSLNSTDKPDFELYANSSEGDGTGIGTYPIKYMDHYIEHFSGGEYYEKMTTGSITITQNSSSNCVGTFTIDVSNSNGTKQVSGSFNVTSF